jgi:nitrite reductase (NADH) small subunit
MRPDSSISRGAKRVTESVRLEKNEVPTGSRKIVRVGRVDICIFNVDGQYFAIRNQCVHQLGPVCEGGISGALFARPEGRRLRFDWEKEGQILTCPWHGLEFDIATGRCLTLKELRLRSYEVKVGENELTVAL